MSHAMAPALLGQACGAFQLRPHGTPQSISFSAGLERTAPQTPDRQLVVSLPNQRVFDALAEVWLGDTRALSSVTQIARHPAYRALVAMGPLAVPMMLERMAREPEFWFMALEEITGENPAGEAQEGNIAAMTQCWIAWGKARGYLG